MKLIPLSRGLHAQVSDRDFKWLTEGWKWQAWKSSKGKTFYAVRGKGKNKRYMHRVILGLTSRKQQGDHKDSNGLNNQRRNLRVATNQQNARNKGPQSNNKSGIRGVYWYASRSCWRAEIKTEKHRKHLGYFKSLRDATKVRQQAVKKFFKSFAKG